MTTKTTGSEFKKFYSDPDFWPEGYWHENEDIKANGLPRDGDKDLTALNDADIIEVGGGSIFTEDGDQISTMEAYFKKWKSRQMSEIFVVEAPNDRVREIKDAIAICGGRIIRP